jgi:hypothetical protein
MFQIEGIVHGSYKKLARKILLGDLDKHSRRVGYITWKELRENTFQIFIIPSDVAWFATQLSNKKYTF